MDRTRAWMLIAVVAVGLLAFAGIDSGGPSSDDERVQRLSSQFACPTCAGQSVDESNAAVAVTIRRFIADQVAAGATDRQIRDQLIDSYGGEVLLRPPSEGIGALVWILPIVAIAVSAAVVGIAVTRRGVRSRDASEVDRELVADARVRRDDAARST